MGENGGLKGKINLTITAVSTFFVVLASILVYMFPDATGSLAGVVFGWVVNNLGVGFLWVAFLGLLLQVWLYFSKYGYLRLGAEKPDFSKLSVFFMLFSASFGASALYWIFTEVMYYYNDTPFHIEPLSAEAAEYGMAYNFFHWGPSAWSIFLVCVLPFIYSFYLKKNNSFSLSEVCQTIFGNKIPRSITKSFDGLLVFACFGACSVSLGLAVPMISTVIANVFNIQVTPVVNISIILLISVIFMVTSYFGLDRGMARLSDLTMILMIVFLILLVVFGDSQFMLASSTNAIGIMFDKYMKMSFWMDPIEKGGFPQNWTIFYWAYWFIFGPFMAVFIARIFKGYTIRDVIALVLGAGTFGSYLMHGIAQNFTMQVYLEGKVNAAEMVMSGQGNQMIVDVIRTLPFSGLILIIFALVCILFMATTLDSNSFTLASVCTKELNEGANPSAKFRLYWSLILFAIPLVLTLIHADLNILKTIAYVVAIPLVVLMCILAVLSVKGIVKMFGDKSKEEIKQL